jgi:diaminohydroxyphosphoribosylaminopyrimidine deaminase / 5-amino-6-(5-phosphoribosylamino)uracil reductase
MTLAQHMPLAHAQAALARGLSNPNPAVGCVIVSAAGEVIGQGHTQLRGGAHAEVMALRDVASRGLSAKGATAYVTLEPCSHHGRTPPCVDALVSAGVAKVVVALLDPFPEVNGRGVARLREAGIEVEVLPADHTDSLAARELNLGFLSRVIRKSPWVRMKIAASLDGQTALPDGTSQWITGEAARADGHRSRLNACAVLTGIGTVLADNPSIDVRDLPANLTVQRQPHLVIVDSKLETPLDAKLWSTLGTPRDAASEGAKRKIFIYCAIDDATKQSALEAKGATIVRIADSQGKVDLAAMMRDLASREMGEVHVEAGFKLNGSLLRAGVVDELLIYTAPKLIGAGLGMANLPELASLDQAMALEFRSAQLVGADLRIEARVKGRDAF